MSKRTGKCISAAFGVLLIGLALAACTIVSTDSKRMDSSAQKVSAAQLVFNSRPPEKGTIMQSGKGAPQFIGSYQTDVASSAAADFSVVFYNGFRERFPEMASKYGLTVSPTAQPKLSARFTDFSTACVAKCTSRITLVVDLFDGRGKPIWHFSTKVGQSTIFAKIDAQMFDAAAHELLESMKRDGVIGG